ncbi:MAG: DEAD/DEAH box helicase family protein [Ardenticatenales bacterium]|nr:DEAD/DEAH box helicase family protein [Ardenticatenales bacterium]
MPDTPIDNPVLNTPYAEPSRHFRFSDDGITDEVVPGRRKSAYFVPIAPPRKRGRQLVLDTQWTADRLRPNDDINRIRERVAVWRQGGYVDVTPTTRRLLAYWTDAERERPLFFCQIEAMETVIYIAEVARRYGDAWIENGLRDANETANPGLYRLAMKMATGTGKTVVMGMLIAWQALNKLANAQDARFSDAFLIVAPGITIRDRLRVLMPNDPANYYRQRDIVSSDDLARLQQAKIVITNFHAFGLREKMTVARATKAMLGADASGAFTESAPEMVRRVCRDLGNKRGVIVINDEAHHCYRRKTDAPSETLDADEREAAAQREKEARVWIGGLEAVQAKLGIRAIYDLSATPFFLKGSGYDEGKLFGWVVSDFSLIDAIEAGLVKVPRVPVADNALLGVLPTYRDLWVRIRDDLPKKGRKTEALDGEPRLPIELQGALHSLYSNYVRYHADWEANAAARAGGLTPPVFIVVCQNTNISNLVYRYVAGWEKSRKGEAAGVGDDGDSGNSGDDAIVQAGALDLFRNDDGRGGWLQRPNTILIDSQQLESGAAMSDAFKRIAAPEIDEFKAEYRQRYPGRDIDKLTDEDLLREVMNTVGKPGKLGEHVKCVISVSMLTEGWDANTVTHVLGVRAFGTQLLCEQVVGRALRRISYATNDDGTLPPEYAEVYGVPFSFIPTSGSQGEVKPVARSTRVHAVPERTALEMTFPRLTGYRYVMPAERLRATFGPDASLAISTADVPTRVQMDPIVGAGSEHTLDDLRAMREQSVAFHIARLLLTRYFQDDEVGERPWLFPQLLAITLDWMRQCVVLKDNTFPQLLLLTGLMHEAASRIYGGIVAADAGEGRLWPSLRDYDPIGSTRWVDFESTKPYFVTSANKCHISHSVLDSDWEAAVEMAMEEMPEVIRYAKNDHLGFTIPYVIEGRERDYVPDFLVDVDDGHGADDLLHLVLEVTGERRPEKAAKVRTAREQWVPAVNNHGGFGRWGFVEVGDPYEAQGVIRAVVRTLAEHDAVTR